ncbi:MAG TPA: nitrilase-related carbon-nitrogen hydrolase [Solirubrobacteraceae bacterium]|nr:nitrilase-related carbon-nitrogen hydrolase [Solirubrobacteraceae bacterium]
MTRVCCQQLDPVVGDLDRNRERALTAIAEGVELGADVIVLPELVTSGYVFESAEEAAALSIAPDHEILREWADAARRHEVIVAGGFAERGADGRTYNSAAVVDRSGLRAVYRKLHLWDREKLWFAPGEQPPPVIDTSVGKLSVLVCYDVEFPELTRMVALAGTQLLLVPTNWPLGPRPDGERPAEVVIAMAAARGNRMAVACADRAGIERDQPWTGCTTIIGADGWIAAEKAGTEALTLGPVTADLDLGLALDKRYTELADVFADRRPSLYAPLAQ